MTRSRLSLKRLKVRQSIVLMKNKLSEKFLKGKVFIKLLKKVDDTSYWIDIYNAKLISDKDIALSLLDLGGDGIIDSRDAILLLRKANDAKIDGDNTRYNHYSKLADLAQSCALGNLSYKDITLLIFDTNKA